MGYESPNINIWGWVSLRVAWSSGFSNHCSYQNRHDWGVRYSKIQSWKKMENDLPHLDVFFLLSL